MMKFLLLLPLALLSACDAQPESAVANPEAASQTSKLMIQAENEAPPEKQIQTLISRDNKIRINVENTNFTDIIQQTEAHPTDLTGKELTLLQYDKERNIKLYTANLGAAQTDAKTYFANLKSILESDQNLTDVRVGMATDNRMNYQFAQQDDTGKTLSENCIAIHESNIYDICVNSNSASQEELSKILQEVNLIK